MCSSLAQEDLMDLFSEMFFYAPGEGRRGGSSPGFGFSVGAGGPTFVYMPSGGASGIYGGDRRFYDDLDSDDESDEEHDFVSYLVGVREIIGRCFPGGIVMDMITIWLFSILTRI